MSSSVKTVFMLLIGTVCVIVLTSVFVELFNVNINSAQLAQNMKIAARQSCILFTQETYKQDSIYLGNGATNLQDIYAADGTLYVRGKFYNGNNASEIWHNIYGSSEFKSFCDGTSGYINSTDMKAVYPDLNAMILAVSDGFDDDIDPDSSPEEYNLQTKAVAYLSNLYTTVNIGIPYMDREVTNKMFRWNLTQLLSNCDSALIQRDEFGQEYVNYKGFKVFCDQAKLVRYTYEVLDLSNNDDKTKLQYRTGIDASKLGLTTGNGSDKSNNYVTLVGIEYSVPVSYVGITPIKRVFNYAWNNEVEGYHSPSGGGYNNVNSLAWTDDKRGFISGGLNNTSSATRTTEGKLIYEIIR